MTIDKKQAKALENALSKTDFSDSFAENSAVQWISHNGRTILWFVFGLLAISLLIYRLLGLSSGSSIKDYAEAEKEFRLFSEAKATEKGAIQAEKSLASLTLLLNKHPELQAKYEGELAQHLFNRGQANAAFALAERTIARLSQEHLPFYRDYSATTLLIEGQNYAEALQQSQNLQNQLNKLPAQQANSGLLLLNQLRIATLHQKLGEKNQELKSWQTLHYLLTEKETGLSSEQTLQALKQGNLNILDYITYRTTELQN